MNLVLYREICANYGLFFLEPTKNHYKILQKAEIESKNLR